MTDEARPLYVAEIGPMYRLSPVLDFLAQLVVRASTGMLTSQTDILSSIITGIVDCDGVLVTKKL